MREKRLACGNRVGGRARMRRCVLVWYTCPRDDGGDILSFSEKRIRRCAAMVGTVLVDAVWIPKAGLKAWLKGKRFLG